MDDESKELVVLVTKEIYWKGCRTDRGMRGRSGKTEEPETVYLGR